MNITKVNNNYDALDDTFGVIQPLDGGLFEVSEIKEANVCYVWTIIAIDDEDILIASPGIKFVNRLGYILTVRPWDAHTEDYLWSD